MTQITITEDQALMLNISMQSLAHRYIKQTIIKLFAIFFVAIRMIANNITLCITTLLIIFSRLKDS